MTDEPVSINMNVVYVRVPGGRIHLGVRIEGRASILSIEGCNLDDAKLFEVLQSLPESAEAADLCERCFPWRDDA